MLDTSPRFPSLPAAPGVGYKPQHFADITANAAPVEWLEIHAENYMGAGGRPLAQLRHLAEKFAFSVHGVGLSIGGELPLDKDHLARLKHLCDWLQPASFSEHLAWSTHDSHFLNDLLPLPYTKDTLTRVADHIDEVQEVVGRQMLLENPSSYLAFEESTYEETDFLDEVAKRTGCGLLLDVNNIFVSATNLKLDPRAYVDAFPLHLVGEIHLGGHDEDEDDHGAPLLIDSHGREVADPVWTLLDYTLERSGAKPLLLDVNNIFVSATNLKLDPRAYVDAFPLHRVGEIHLGGHDEDEDDHGAPLLIDSHGREVADPVWTLLDYTLERSGAKPLLIEWDADIPDWTTLAEEAQRAARALEKVPA